MAVYINNVDLPSNVNNFYDRNILFVGIKSAIGTATDYELKRDIKSISQVDEYFGNKSHIAQGLNYAVNFAKLGNFGDYNLKVNAIAFNGVGTKATSNILFDGTATETKTLKIYVGNKSPKTLNVATGTTASQLVSSLVSLLEADLKLFFSSAVNGAETKQIDFTASVEGTWINKLSIKLEDLADGLTSTITQFTGGNYTGLTNLTALKNAILKYKFDSIVIEKDLLDIDATLKDFFDERALYLQNKDLMGMVLFADINSTESSIVNNYKTNQWGVCIARKKSYVLPYLLLSDLACMKEGRLVLDFKTSQISSVSGNGGVYNTSGPIDNLRLNTIDTLQADEKFNDTELESLKDKGFLTIEENENELAIFKGNRSMYVLDQDGNIPNLNRITDFEKKSLFSSLTLEETRQIIGKTLKQSIVNEDHDITKADIKGILRGILNACLDTRIITRNGTVQEIKYGILNDDPKVIEEMQKTIDISVDKLQPSRNITLQQLSMMAIIIENVSITNSFSN